MPVCQPYLTEYLKARKRSLPGAQGNSVQPEINMLSEELIRVKDFTEGRGVSLDINDDRVIPEDTLIRGDFFCQELRQGLTVHCGNGREEHAYTAKSILGPGLSCIFILDGELEIQVGESRFAIKNSKAGRMGAVAFLKTSAQPFQRISKQAQRVCHLVVSASPQWLEKQELGGGQSNNLNTDNPYKRFSAQQWMPSPRLCQLVGEMIRPTLFNPELLNLYLECRAVEVVIETLSAMTKQDSTFDYQSKLTRHDAIRMQRARHMIDAQLSQDLSVESIAREAGISASGLQKLFHRSEGISVFQYVRRARMNQAFSILRSGGGSVQQASVVAGYKSPENFATAFKRQFGINPREASQT